MNCKDCSGYDFCPDYKKANFNENVEVLCDKFKDKARFIELPCKVGDRVYYIGSSDPRQLEEGFVDEVQIDGYATVIIIKEALTRCRRGYVLGDFGKRIFTSRKDAR